MADLQTKSQQLTEALSALYTGDRATKERANTWLEEFQKTPEAWSISDTILQSNASSTEIRLFAAQTFRTKITYDLTQLKTQERLSLRDSLLHLLHQYRAGPRIIATQLCLSLAGLALQLPEWNDVVRHMVELYGSSNDTLPCLLEFLTVLPEEISDNRRIPISDELYKSRSFELLTKNGSEVLRLLVHIMQNAGSDADMQSKMFQCLLSWMKSGDIDINALSSTPLLTFAFDALESDDLFNVAVDVVCQVIQETREINEYMGVINMVYPRLAPLREKLKQSTVTAAEDDADDDQLRGLCRIFSEAGEAYLPLVMQHPNAFDGVVEGLLDCAAVHDLQIVPMTFNFWYELAKLLVLPQNATAKERYAPAYDKLVDVMIRHLRYPDDLTTWSAQERDDFRDFRHVMGDVLKDCCVVLGATTCLAKVYEVLAKRVVAGESWQDLEAPLFGLRAMGAEVPDDEANVLPQIMQMLSQLPDHPKIRYAATLVISRYSYWTRKHPEFIPYQLNFISSGFDKDDVGPAAAMALKYLCKDCSELLIDYLTQLHPFYVNVVKQLKDYELFEVTEAVAYVVAAVPAERLLSCLQMFCAPIAQRLHEIMIKGKAACNEAEIAEAIDLIEQIVIFTQVCTPRDIPTTSTHPTITLVNDLWPVFDLVLTNFGDNETISERVAKLFKTWVVCYGPHFLPMVPKLVERLVRVFDATELSCYLWVATKVVREFAAKAGRIAQASEVAAYYPMLESMSSSAFRIFQSKKFVDIPDTVEEFFRLVTSFVDVAPNLLVHSPILPSVIQVGFAVLSLEHEHALASTLVFFQELLGIATRPEAEVEEGTRLALRELFRAQGVHFVAALFNGMIYHAPRELVADFGGVLRALENTFPAENREWLKMVVDGFPAGHMTPEERVKFVGDMDAAFRDEQHWRRLRRVLNDFVAMYRRRNVTRAARKVE
ncbi:uncharacterized protein VTP21DRAFT_4974 [Calcarisporiella thermophila]|uniref:uncharacterized protein n=1 Tax=Calcarisporiella thermophila TaxID=911321 RepID=UPI003743BA83